MDSRDRGNREDAEAGARHGSPTAEVAAGANGGRRVSPHVSATNGNCEASSVGVRRPSTAGQTREEQMVALYMELNGVTESQARAVYGHLDTAQRIYTAGSGVVTNTGEGIQ